MSLRPDDTLSLLDWKRQIHELYAMVRANPDPMDAWTHWRETRDHLFRHHPQSPLPLTERSRFTRLSYFNYDPAARVVARFQPERESVAVPGSAGGSFEMTRCGRLEFDLFRVSCELDAFWVAGYGGGLFVPVRDETSGVTTYGGGRYVLDTIKGADLGVDAAGLVLDFNFSYNPSCSYDPSWACPLPPPANHLVVAVAAGEMLTGR